MQIQSIIYNTETTFAAILTLSIASFAMLVGGCYLLHITHVKYAKDRKATADFILTAFTTIAMLASSFLLAFIVSSRIHTPQASLKSIEKFITVEEGKVKISSWSKELDFKKFDYDDRRISKKTDQIFQLKADETYERYSLIDQKSKEHSISKEEYELLRSKRHS